MISSSKNVQNLLHNQYDKNVHWYHGLLKAFMHGGECIITMQVYLGQGVSMVYAQGYIAKQMSAMPGFT